MSDYEKVDYQQGKIYKIVSNDCDLVYIGSTAQYKLEDRLAGHVSCFECGKYYSSCELIKQPHYDIIELQAYPCNSKAELGVQERFWILKYRDDGINVVNIHTPSGIEAENIVDYNKQYWQDNKKKLSVHKKEYYEENKEKIKKRDATKVTCDCGCEVTKKRLPKHKKTKRHIAMMSTM